MKVKIFIFVGFLLLLTINVHAVGEEQKEQMQSSISSQTEKTLNNFGIEKVDDIESAGFSKIFSGTFNIVKDSYKEPIKLFALLTGIAVLSSLYNLFVSNKQNDFSILAGMLCAGTVITAGISDKIEQISLMLNEGGNFIGTFVPVMGAVTAAGGYTITATAYNILLLFSSNVVSYSSSGIVASLLGCYLAVSLVSSFNNELNLSGFANGIKQVAIWGLGIISTVFVAILSLEGLAGKAADSVALKTAKFALNSAIPIVGTALSDAVASLEGSIGILRASVGTFGIIVGLAIALPTVINVILTKLAIEGAGVAAQMLGAKKIAELYKNMGSVMTVLIALVAFFFLVLLVSTTVVLLICS